MKENRKDNKKTGAKQEAGQDKNIKKKMLITVGLIVCGFCLLVLKLASISIINHDKYLQLATDQQLRDTVIAAPRGTIYDTNMNVLAQSAPAWTVAIVPNSIKDTDDYDTIARGLSEILGMDYQTIYDKCGINSWYSIVKRQVDQPVADQIRAFVSENGLPGIQLDEDSKRYYPYENFAAQLLGFVGSDNQGLSGLELYYDSYLSGTPGRKMTATTAVGGDMYYDYATVYEAQAGYSLVLTIDEYIQFYLEKHLESAVAEHNVQQRACGIVMNVNTGEILAIATKGDFDPNDPFTIYDDEQRAYVDSLYGTDEYYAALEAARQEQWRNKAVSELYEPGSVYKVITAAAALETGSVTLDSTFYCSGSVDVADWTISCALSSGHGQETFVQATINSCNPAFIEIGRRTGAENFYNYFEAFGFTELTGIDLPGEASSLYIPLERMGATELASCSFGQSNKITPIQMITAVCATVNGGYLVQPHVVRQVIDEDGNIVESYEPEAKRQVISAETSELMAEIMEQVVMNANGRNAYVAGFRIGGKSGTSEKLGGDEKAYWASFCAIAPADNPEIAVLIILDEAQSSTSIYGGVIAAPIAGAIMADVLPHIGVDAVYTTSEMALVDIGTPLVEGQSLTNAYASLNKTGLTYQVVGSGATVVAQYPIAGQSIPPGSVVMLYTEEQEPRTVMVPDLSGRTIESARALLKSMGLNLKVSGSSSSRAEAVSQSVAPGEEVPTGTVIVVDFIHSVND